MGLHAARHSGHRYGVSASGGRDAGHITPFPLQGDTHQVPERAITGIAVKQAGIALPEPTQTALNNWTASCVITGHLVASLRGTAEFRLGDHALLMGEGREEI